MSKGILNIAAYAFYADGRGFFQLHGFTKDGFEEAPHIQFLHVHDTLCHVL